MSLDHRSPDPKDWKLPSMLEVPFETVELKKVWIQKDCRTDRFVYLMNPKLFFEEQMHEMIMSLKAATLGYDHEPVKVSLPKSGWDALKEHFFPEWLKRWFPVEYEDFDLDVRMLYPFLKPPITDSPVVVFVKRRKYANYSDSSQK